jgi:hypothetical protein
MSGRSVAKRKAVVQGTLTSSCHTAGSPRTSKRCRHADGARSHSNVWLLRARPFDGDIRSKEATELKVYLVPGREYLLGTNPKVCDVVIGEDRTVSRAHATLRVIPDRYENGVLVEGHVEVSDKSSHGRTYLTKDKKDILSGEKIKSLGDPAKAYHSYFLMLGQMSPFRLTRMNYDVCLDASLSERDRRVILDDLGMFSVDLEDTVRSPLANVRVIVDKEEEDLLVLGDDVVLALAAGIPVVTPQWAHAWLRKGTWIGSGPRDEDYRVRITGRNANKNGGDSAVISQSQRRLVADALARKLGEYQLVFFKDSSSQQLVRAAQKMGLRSRLEENISEWVVESNGRPLVVLAEEKEVQLLPHSAYHYCLADELRYAILDGLTEDLLHWIGDGDRSAEDIVDSEGWHVVGCSALAGRAHATGNAETSTACDPDSIESQVIIRKDGFTSKTFKKKHRVPDPSAREIVEVIGSKPSRGEEDKEWVKIERERQSMDAAFEKQGLIIQPKKRNARMK